VTSEVIIISLCFLCLLMLLYILFLISKVHRILKFQDKVLLLSLTSLALSVFCLLIFCIMIAVSRFLENGPYIKDDYLDTTLQVAEPSFIYIALMFDLYKWCMFLIGTIKDTSMEGATYDYTKKRLKIAKIILVIVQSWTIFASILLIILLTNCKKENRCRGSDNAMHYYTLFS